MPKIYANKIESINEQDNMVSTKGKAQFDKKYR